MSAMNTGWVSTVLRKAGAVQPDKEWLRSVLLSLGEDLSDAVKRALRAADEGSPPGLLMAAKIGAILGAAESQGQSIHHVLELLHSELGVEGTSGEMVEAPEDTRAIESADKTGSGREKASAPARKRDKEYVNYHVHSMSAAMTFEEDSLKGQDGRRTVSIDAAEMVKGKPAWKRKITIQLSLNELPLFACVLVGLVPKVKFDGHGSEHDKWIALERQTGKLYLKVGKGKRVVATPISAGDSYNVIALSLGALIANGRGLLGADGVMASLRVTASIWNEGQKANEGD